MTDDEVFEHHRALAPFLGEWHAEGTSYAPDGTASPWKSIHSARWHVGEFFVLQDERANGPFHTMSFLGWDPDRGGYFSWSVENHGFAHQYSLAKDGLTWTFTGENERATVTFSAHGHQQTHHWEHRPEGEWVTLCERVATRVE
ncbi:DUF1579 family protein [Naasia lichenicola]|uniref:DUF1579 domain-containing protein n=1 Tax=Naasia lichenicola TaxID=2565933 RepID=A0A4S4FPY0_9MICO|nr:DUF1579 family protein [Naasia lichenicola]THG30635.1 DUF1579 domain-containing protein [Naasia lichenicola]THG31872.1 DUF1579 domain-containing protein [Naasia lichenicola]